jgi:hypothetical protein
MRLFEPFSRSDPRSDAPDPLIASDDSLDTVRLVRVTRLLRLPRTTGSANRAIASHTQAIGSANRSIAWRNQASRSNARNSL